MKELSIEEKAKRYDESIQRAKKELASCGNGRTKMLKRIFSELKESEDERIRKELLQIAKGSEDSFYMVMTPNKREKLIAWLEKQGEQKSADNVEHKFEVGDWIITNKNHIWYVDETPETTSYLYRLINQYGKVEVAEFEIVDKKARLWTIQDAKDGDVLACKNDIVIFKENNYNPKDESGCMFVYCSCNNFYEIGGITPTDYKPATKEQRDLLFQKMKEAGYEWDTEKKELKKIESKPADEIGNYDHKEVIQTIINEQKPAWSEEEIEKAAQEWDSKANFKPFHMTPTGVKQDITTHKESFKAGINWILKSLRSQNTWKPSDKQMKAIEHICDGDYNVDLDILDSIYRDFKKLRGELK